MDTALFYFFIILFIATSVLILIREMTKYAYKSTFSSRKSNAKKHKKVRKNRK